MTEQCCIAQDRFLCRPLDAVCVKGTTVPVYVYELITDMVNATDRQVCGRVTYRRLYIRADRRLVKSGFPLASVKLIREVENGFIETCCWGVH